MSSGSFSVSFIENIVPRVSLSFLFSYHEAMFRRLIAKSSADKPLIITILLLVKVLFVQ